MFVVIFMMVEKGVLVLVNLEIIANKRGSGLWRRFRIVLKVQLPIYTYRKIYVVY